MQDNGISVRGAKPCSRNKHILDWGLCLQLRIGLIFVVLMLKSCESSVYIFVNKKIIYIWLYPMFSSRIIVLNWMYMCFMTSLLIGNIDVL